MFSGKIKIPFMAKRRKEEYIADPIPATVFKASKGL